MSIFGSKNFGLSDSLIDAAKSIKGREIPTYLEIEQGLAEKLSSKEKMKRGLYNDTHGMDPVNKKELKGKHADRKDKDIDNDGDVDSTDKYLHKRRKAITKNIKKNGDTDNGTDPVDTDPKMDDMKEEILKEDDVQAKMRQLMKRDGHDPDKVSDGGMFDRYRAMAKRELGIRDQKEAAGSRSIDKTDGDNNIVNQGSSDIHKCAKQVAHEQWGDGECIFGEHAEPDANGHVEWYDVLFSHGVEHKVPVAEMKVKTEGSHGSHKKKNK